MSGQLLITRDIQNGNFGPAYPQVLAAWNIHAGKNLRGHLSQPPHFSNEEVNKGE